MLISIAWLIFAVPESPIWLFEKRRFVQLEHCLTKMGKINGIQNLAEKVSSSIEKLKVTANMLDDEH